MADTFTNDLRLRLQEAGANSNQWGDLLNYTITNIASAFGSGTEDMASDADTTITLADDGSSTDEARSLYLKITSSASLTATRTVTIGPNTISKVYVIENATTGGQSIAISQGSGANVTIPTGTVKVVHLDGAGSGAAVTDSLVDLHLTGTTAMAAATIDSRDVGTQSIVSTAPTSASGYPNGHVWYVTG